MRLASRRVSLGVELEGSWSGAPRPGGGAVLPPTPTPHFVFLYHLSSSRGETSCHSSEGSGVLGPLSPEPSTGMASWGPYRGCLGMASATLLHTRQSSVVLCGALWAPLVSWGGTD